MIVTGVVRLTRDPESKQFANSNVCKFTVVENDKRGKEEVATFLDCEVWGKLAETAQNYLSKGTRVFVVGDLKQDTWEDKASGGKRSKHVLKISNFKFVDAKKSEESDSQASEGDENTVF